MNKKGFTWDLPWLLGAGIAIALLIIFLYFYGAVLYDKMVAAVKYVFEGVV